MSEKVRIGFVGVGSMGQCAHLKNYAVLPDCEVVALAELRRDTAARVAGRYGVPNVYGDYSEMLAAESLDALVASQPFRRHGQILPDLLAAGLPVFCEKPLAGAVEVAERIVKAVDASDGWLMVGYNKRSDPATICAKAEIDRLKGSGELGALRYVRILMPPGDCIAGGFADRITGDDGRLELDQDPPAADMDAETYDAYVKFVNYYIHQVNLMRHLLGEPYQVTYADPSGVLLVGRSAGGVACTIEMAPYKTTVDWQESALICFERGTVELELPAPLAANRPGRVQFLRDPGDGATPEIVTPQLPWVHSMKQQALNFIRAVKGEAKPPCEAAEALEDLRLARDYLRLLRGA